MLEQQQTEEVQQAVFSAAPPLQSGPASPEAAPAFADAALQLSPPAQILIARYLAQTGTEQVSDTRARLEALTIAYSELEATPSQAVEAAIRHLESERQTQAQQEQAARQQIYGQRKKARAAWQSARPATHAALKLFGAATLPLIALPLVMVAGHPAYDGVLARVLLEAWFFTCLGLPAMLGILTGARSRHRAGMGTFYAIIMLSPLAALVSELAGRVFAQEGFWVMGLILAMFWLPIGVTSAGLTAWGRDTLRRRRRREAAARAIRVQI